MQPCGAASEDARYERVHLTKFSVASLRPSYMADGTLCPVRRDNYDREG